MKVSLYKIRIFNRNNRDIVSHFKHFFNLFYKMKTVRFFMMTFLMSLFCVTLSFAQGAQKPASQTPASQTQQVKKPRTQAQQGQTQKPQVTPEDRAAKRLEMMKKSLNLTDQQVVQVQDAQKQLSDDTKQIRAKSGGKDNVAANRTEMKAKTDAYNAKLKTILTPEQYQKYMGQNKGATKKAVKKEQQGTTEQLKATDKKPVVPVKKPQPTKEAAK